MDQRGQGLRRDPSAPALERWSAQLERIITGNTTSNVVAIRAA